MTFNVYFICCPSGTVEKSSLGIAPKLKIEMTLEFTSVFTLSFENKIFDEVKKKYLFGIILCYISFFVI